MAIRWATYLDVNPGKTATWDCLYCENRGLQKERNCDGILDGQCPNHKKVRFDELETDEETGKLKCVQCGKIVKMPFQLRLGKGFWIWRCPLQELDQEAAFAIRLVNWSEAIHQTPSGHSLLEESNLYFEIRNFVLREQQLAREELEKKQPENDKRRQGSRSPRPRRKR